MNKVKLDLYAPLGRLEHLKQKRYSSGDIASATKNRITRQAIYRILNTTPDSINFETIGALLDFFASEGMPISIADLFTVTDEPSESQPASKEPTPL